MVSRFVASGAPIGLGLMVYLLWRGYLPIEVIAALLCYALACELYIFVFTMISSSVSVSLLLRLRDGKADWHQLDAQYSDSAMVGARLTKLLANGLIRQTPQGYAVTPRGQALTATFDRLRRFFRLTEPGRTGGAARSGRTDAPQPAGQDVG